MAQIVTVTCDRSVRGKACAELGETYVVTKQSEQTSWSVDLCDKHAETVWGVAVSDGQFQPPNSNIQRRTMSALRRPWTPERATSDNGTQAQDT